MDSFFWDILAVLAISGGVQWALEVRGAGTPRKRGEIYIYQPSWKVRVVFLAVAAGLLAVVIDFRKEYFDSTVEGIDLLAILVFGGFFLSSLFMLVGSVEVGPLGITKKLLFHACSLSWTEITIVEVNKNPGGDIKLRSAKAKLTIDFRFAARDHLLNEIIARTGLQPKV